MIEKVERRRSQRFFEKGNRDIIKGSLSGIPTYYTSIVPEKLWLKDWNDLMNFFVGTRVRRKQSSKWEIITSPMKTRETRDRDFRAFNIELLGK